MRNLKDELQHIILGDGPARETYQLKKVQIFPGGNAEAGLRAQKPQRLKSEEAAELLNFDRHKSCEITGLIVKNRKLLLEKEMQKRLDNPQLKRYWDNVNKCYAIYRTKKLQ